MLQIVVTSFVTGMGILAVAIVLNFVAGRIGLDTWYSFVSDPGNTSVLSYVWLFVAYPFLLGLTTYFILKLMNQ